MEQTEECRGRAEREMTVNATRTEQQVKITTGVRKQSCRMCRMVVRADSGMSKRHTHDIPTRGLEHKSMHQSMQEREQKRGPESRARQRPERQPPAHVRPKLR